MTKKYTCSKCKKLIPEGEQIWLIAPDHKKEFCSKCICEFIQNKPFEVKCDER